MNAHIETKAMNQLTLDARKQPVTATIDLHIIDKKDPDSWYMMFNQTVVNSIAIRTWQPNYAKLIIKIKSADEKLRFAQPASCNARQVFPGLLFVAGNHTMKELAALCSETKEPDEIIVSINPSTFWAPKQANECLKVDGNKIGFRFIVVDEKDDAFFSHDPYISGPDWERL